MVEVGNNTNCKCQAKAKDIDKCKNPVLIKIPESYNQVISKHILESESVFIPLIQIKCMNKDDE